MVTGLTNSTVNGSAGNATPAKYAFTLTSNIVVGQKVTVSLGNVRKVYTAVASTATPTADQFKVGGNVSATANNLSTTIAQTVTGYTAANTTGSAAIILTQNTPAQTNAVLTVSVANN